MRTSRTGLRLLSSVVLASLAQSALAQEFEPDPIPEEPDLTDLAPISPESRSDRLTELFLAVERKLARIDTLLLEASTGDTSKLSEVEESGLEDLLEEGSESQSSAPSGAGGQSSSSAPGGKGGSAPGGSDGQGTGARISRSRAQGQQVVRGIDEILRVASQP